MDEGATTTVSQTKAEETPQKRPWSRGRKLVVGIAVAFLAIVAIGLGVGLGVGLTRGGDSDDDDGSNNNNSNTDSDSSRSGPKRSAAWVPQAGDTWQIVLKNPIVLDGTGDINPDVAVYDLDLYDNDVETFRALQEADKRVICYFSAGSWEDWRDDKDDFDDADLGNELDGWPDERWLNVSSPAVRNIMKKRLRYAREKGCDAVDPDNVDGYQNDSGFDLTTADAVDFMRFLSDEAKSLQMAIGLKNAKDIIPRVLDFMDFSVNEQCIEYSECDGFSPFIDADKPVFNIEYPPGAPNNIADSVRNEICSHRGNATGSEGFSKVIKKLNLDGWVEYCDGETYTTEMQS